MKGSVAPRGAARLWTKLSDPSWRQKKLDMLWAGRLRRLIPEMRRYKKGTIVYIRRRADELGIKSLGGYARLLDRDSAERAYIRTRLTAFGSHFFRGNDWGVLREACLPAYRDHDRIRVWCAGCSSGEEVFSIIMALADLVPPERISVLATDYNDGQLKKCRKAEYVRVHYEEIPGRYRKYVSWLPDGNRFTFGAELTDIVTLEKLDLLKDSYPGPFDIILCRNVIKFFAPEVIPPVQERLASSLAPGGTLFLSDDDRSSGIELIRDPGRLGLVQVMDRCIYRKEAESAG